MSYMIYSIDKFLNSDGTVYERPTIIITENSSTELEYDRSQNIPNVELKLNIRRYYFIQSEKENSLILIVYSNVNSILSNNSLKS